MRAVDAVRRWLAWPMWALVAAALLLSGVQLLVEQPLLLGYGLIMMAAIVLVADPRRVGGLMVLLAVVGALVPLLDGPDVEGYWARYPWMLAFGALAVWLSAIEQRRIRRAGDSSRLLHDILEATNQPVFAKRFDQGPDGEGRYVLGNGAWRRVMGARGENALGLTDADLFDPEVLPVLRSADEAVLRSRAPMTLEEKVGSTPDRIRTFLVTKFPLLGEDGDAWGVGGIATDVTARKRMEERLVAVFDESPVAAVRFAIDADRRARVVAANEAVSELLGTQLSGLGPEALDGFIHPEDRTEAWGGLGSVIAGDGPLSARELRLVDVHGRTHWVRMSASAIGEPDHNGSTEVVVQMLDLTDRKELEAALTSKALTDPVTGLPNRHAVNDRLATAVSRLRRHPGVVCVLFCDLDHFKNVNDAYGHQVGDLLLAEVALRLSGALRPEDTVGRLGGDEFVVVCEGFTDPTEAAMLALRLQERLHLPWAHGDHQFVPTASIGVAFTSDPDAEPGDLLRQADIAMYRAKDSGRSRIEIYDRSLDDELALALSVQQRLREALAGDGLVLHYQPVVRLSDGAVVGCEALLRMRDGLGGLLPPDSFLPHAEASGLIGAVGAWVLDRAFVDVRRWHDAGHRVDVGVNLSPTQLARAGFADDFFARMAAHGVDPSWVVAEVTETALMSESSVAYRALADLHDRGVRIALDDFGTGYSSLSWLHRFPVDIVKIDKSFVQSMVTDHRRAVVVRAVLDIADEIGLGVVAEGVETDVERQVLLELGCATAQGWLFGRAVEVEAAFPDLAAVQAP
jgi:diguanylate cyclase (GGDEF)-like protein/PAS domain S-box-containing protein